MPKVILSKSSLKILVLGIFGSFCLLPAIATAQDTQTRPQEIAVSAIVDSSLSFKVNYTDDGSLTTQTDTNSGNGFAVRTANSTPYGKDYEVSSSENVDTYNPENSPTVASKDMPTSRGYVTLKVKANVGNTALTCTGNF